MNAKKSSPPYIAGTHLTTFFERIRTMQPPKKLDTKWAVANGISTGQPSALTGALQWLGVIDENGDVDAEKWNGIRLAQTRAQSLDPLVRDSYAEVFKALDVEDSDRDHLTAVFVNSYGSGNPKNQIKSFLALCEMAGIAVGARGPKSTESESGEDKSKSTKPKSSAPTRATNNVRSGNQPSSPIGQVQVSLNVEIPADWSSDQIRARIKDVRSAITEG